MGLEDSDILKDDDDGKSTSSVLCSICLSDVNDFRERSFAKLQCGHQFHLDCIGSAFNMKGAMQCPNCRKIGKGQWLNGSGGSSFLESRIEEYARRDYLSDIEIRYPNEASRFDRSPFNELTSTLDDGEVSSTSHPDLPGNHAIFADHATVSSATAHPCPYVGYFRLVHPASLNSRNVPESSNSNNRHWNGPSIPAFYTPSEPIMRPLTCPLHSSGTRTGSSGAISMIPPYPGGNARARDRVRALHQTYYQRSSSPAIRMPMISASQGSTNQDGGSDTGPRHRRYLQRPGSVRPPPSQDGS